MAAIDHVKFATECLNSADFFGTWAHYMLAVAQLRSQINDAKVGDEFGPFMLGAERWNEQRTDPDLNLDPDDIQSWKKQCALFACWTHKVHAAVVTSTRQNPTAEDLYSAQWPGASTTGLDQAFTDTAGLINPPAQVATAATALPVQPPG